MKTQTREALFCTREHILIRIPPVFTDDFVHLEYFRADTIAAQRGDMRIALVTCQTHHTHKKSAARILRGSAILLWLWFQENNLWNGRSCANRLRSTGCGGVGIADG